MRSIQISLATAFLVGLMAIAPMAQAAPLLPDTFVPATPVAAPSGTVLESETTNFSSGLTAGTLVHQVIEEAGGFLAFTYQITANTGTSSIIRLTMINFNGFLTDVGYVAGTGTRDPITMDRSADGDVIGFSWTPTSSTSVAPGQTSPILVIRTNATDYQFDGSTAVINGGAVNIPTFEPVEPLAAPEPGTLALAMMGVPVALLAWRRRRSTQS